MSGSDKAQGGSDNSPSRRRSTRSNIGLAPSRYRQSPYDLDASTSTARSSAAAPRQTRAPAQAISNRSLRHRPAAMDPSEVSDHPLRSQPTGMDPTMDPKTNIRTYKPRRRGPLKDDTRECRICGTTFPDARDMTYVRYLEWRVCHSCNEKYGRQVRVDSQTWNTYTYGNKIKARIAELDHNQKKSRVPKMPLPKNDTDRCENVSGESQVAMDLDEPVARRAVDPNSAAAMYGADQYCPPAYASNYGLPNYLVAPVPVPPLFQPVSSSGFSLPRPAAPALPPLTVRPLDTQVQLPALPSPPQPLRLANSFQQNPEVSLPEPSSTQYDDRGFQNRLPSPAAGDAQAFLDIVATPGPELYPTDDAELRAAVRRHNAINDLALPFESECIRLGMNPVLTEQEKQDAEERARALAEPTLDELIDYALREINDPDPFDPDEEMQM
ncbi:Fc.00g005090.m01.CDS01 [Cosmosporella sp. VM-42]